MDMRVDAAGDDDLSGRIDPGAPIAAIFSPSMPMSAACGPEGRTAVPPVITTSSIGSLL
jgi:hypothetical protein